MSGHAGARDFLEALTGYSDAPLDGYVPSQDRPARIGTIDPAYAGGNAKVTFDGESALGSRSYVCLVPVAPSDRVVLMPVGRGYVIAGAVSGVRRGASYVVATLADLVAISTAAVGDVAFMTAPATGIGTLFCVADSGSGSGLNWKIVSVIDSTTQTALDDFIAACLSTGDVVFMAGGRIRLTTPTPDEFYVFTSSGLGTYNDDPAFFPRVVLTKSVAQNSSTSTVYVSWGTEVSDIYGMYSSGNNTRITAVRAGLYKVTFQLTQAGTGAWSAGIRVNGSTVVGSVKDARVGSTGASASPLATGFVSLADGDYFEVSLIANAGTQAIIADANTYLICEFMGTS